MLTGFTFQGTFQQDGMIGEIPVAFQLVLSPWADESLVDQAAQALGRFLAHERIQRFEESGGGGTYN